MKSGVRCRVSGVRAVALALFVAFGLQPSAFSQTQPQFDTYGGLVGQTCPATAMSNTNITPFQLITTATETDSTHLVLASTTESNQQTTLALGTDVAQRPVYLAVGGATTTPITVGSPYETPTGGTWGAACAANQYPSGYYCYTGYLAHSSWNESSLGVYVNGTQVAAEKFGAIDSTGFAGGIGAVLGHVSPDNTDSRVWVSLAFSSQPTPAPVVGYSYLPAEVVQVASVSGSTVILSSALQNTHTGTFAVTTGYMTTKKGNGRWNFCDPLGHPLVPISVEEWQAQGSFGDMGSDPYAQNTVTTTTTGAITCSTPPCTNVQVGVASTNGIVAGPGMIVDYGRNPTGTADNVEWANVNAVPTPGTPGVIQLASIKSSHLSGDTIECCQHTTLVNGSNGGNAYTGSALTSAGKYGNSSYPAVNNTSYSWGTLNVPRFKTWGYNGISPAGSNSYFDAPFTSTLGLWDLPEHTNPFKSPFQYTTYECSDGLYNRYGYAVDIVLDGNPKPGHGQSGKVEDYLDPDLPSWAGGQMKYVLPESPWLTVIMPTQTDDCPTMGPGEHFSTTPQNGFQANNTGKIILNAPPYLAVPSNVVRNKAANTTQPLNQRGTFISKMVGVPQILQGKFDHLNFPTAATGSNIGSISCSGANAVVNLSASWLGSHFDPFVVGEIDTVSGTTNFNTASGQPAQVIAAVQGSHQVTLAYPSPSPCPGAATETSGLIAGGPGHQSLTDLNTAWGAGTTGTCVSPGTGYNSWGSCGTLNTGVSVPCSGSPVNCSVPVTGPVDPGSIEVTASNGAVSSLIANDFVASGGNPPVTGGSYTVTNAVTGSNSGVNYIILTLSNICASSGHCLVGGDAISAASIGGCTSANGSWYIVNGSSGYNGGWAGANGIALSSTATPGTASTCNSSYTSGGIVTYTGSSGQMDTMGSTILGSNQNAATVAITQAITGNSGVGCNYQSPGATIQSLTNCATFTLAAYANIFPGQIYTITDGSHTDYALVTSINHVFNSLNYGSVSSITAGPILHSYAATGATLGTTFGYTPGTQNAQFVYGSASSASFYLASAPPAGFSLTAQYHANGWANGGSGLLDEDGRCAGSASSSSPYCSGHTWTGNDNGAIDQNTAGAGSSNAAHTIYGTALFQRDIDFALSLIPTSQYARGLAEQRLSAMPHSQGILSYRHGGARGDPGRMSTLEAWLAFVDVGWGSMVERWDGGLPGGASSKAGITSSYPCLSGGTWTLCSDVYLLASSGSDTDYSLQYLFTITGDKPFYDFMELAADADSALQCIMGIGTRLGVQCVNNTTGAGGPSTNQTDGFEQATTQSARATWAATWLNTILNTNTVNGDVQFVGADWWAPVDTPLAGGQYDDYGALTTQDNLYNGLEDCTAAQQATNGTATEDIAGYPLVSVPEVPASGTCYGNGSDFLPAWQSSVWTQLEAIVNNMQPTIPVVGIFGSGVITGPGAVRF